MAISTPSDTNQLAQHIYHQMLALPRDQLLDLADYIRFLNFKYQQGKGDSEVSLGQRAIPNGQKTWKELDGILAGYDFSPELLAEVRREMWQGLGELGL